MRGQATTVANVVRTPIAIVSPSATLEEAAGLLTADELGLLVVVGPNGIRGVISERDLVAAVADGADLAIERVADHASPDVLSVPESATLDETARLMRDAGIRHLVVTRRDEPVGVVSIRDVLDALLSALVV
ncbi:MAG TPA: CBS domain-containing protein [Egicoccus sp.]|nr:CBS domain-containing protein [Egicoccus sp.]HSK24662.1 CBS domain-containing protein [Egicoccus sp.]